MVMAKKKPTLKGIVVTQSMIKDLKKYLLKLMCGLVLKAKYIDKTYPFDADDSPAKALGRYFEYILTGAIPKNGVIPQPEYYAKALKEHAKDPLRRRLTKDDMKEPYQLAHRNAERVKRYFKIMKIRILPDETNLHVQKGLKAGTIDIVALFNGRRIIIDVKYSGLLFDKWNELGWMWTEEQKKFHGTQAMQYHGLLGIPFYFLVVSSTNDEDIKFLEVEFDEFSLEQHDVEVDDTRKKMQLMVDLDSFHPVPELVRCSKCAIRENCQSRQDAPTITKVRLASDD
jgi:hypothetical protein